MDWTSWEFCQTPAWPSRNKGPVSHEWQILPKKCQGSESHLGLGTD